MTYLTTAQVARLLMVSPASVRLWITKGWINAQVTPGGHRRILRRDVEHFARERGLHLADDAEALRILIIDDDEQFTGYLVEVLSQLGDSVEVAVAHSGFEAGYRAREFNPEVILLDLMMPTIDGFDVCRMLKQDPGTSHIKIIAMTGFHTEENERRILELGAAHCLPKPFEVEALLKLLGLPGQSITAKRAGQRGA